MEHKIFVDGRMIKLNDEQYQEFQNRPTEDISGADMVGILVLLGIVTTVAILIVGLCA